MGQSAGLHAPPFRSCGRVSATSDDIRERNRFSFEQSQLACDGRIDPISPRLCHPFRLWTVSAKLEGQHWLSTQLSYYAMQIYFLQSDAVKDMYMLVD